MKRRKFISITSVATVGLVVPNLLISCNGGDKINLNEIIGKPEKLLDSFKKEESQKAEIESGVSLKAVANSNDIVFVATTTRAGVTDMVEVEKWKAEGKVATSFSFIEELNNDRNNGKQYRETSVVFNGAKLTLTIYELISKKKLDYDAGYTNTFQLFETKNIYKS